MCCQYKRRRCLRWENSCPEDAILNNGEEIFVSTNASSMIALCTVSRHMAKNLKFGSIFQAETKLYPGTPQRGLLKLKFFWRKYNRIFELSKIEIEDDALVKKQKG